MMFAITLAYGNWLGFKIWTAAGLVDTEISLFMQKIRLRS